MEPYPFLANPPDLDAPVLYARDRGARNVDLLDRTPDRRGVPPRARARSRAATSASSRSS